MEHGAFEVGDVVRLASGGPPMTVEKVFDSGDLLCSWFDGGKRERSRFLAATLRKNAGALPMA